MGLKYKNDSLRAKWWDYSNAGTYFITICTKDKCPFFGEIFDGKVELSHVGKIVSEEWLKTSKLRPNMKLELHNFIVMPDHFHALITIGMTEFNGTDLSSDEFGNLSNNQFKPQSNNLGSIIRGFKSAVTMRCKIGGFDFCWQSRYYDVIVKTREQFENVQRYILENPSKWESGGDVGKVGNGGDAMHRVPISTKTPKLHS